MYPLRYTAFRILQTASPARAFLGSQKKIFSRAPNRPQKPSVEGLPPECIRPGHRVGRRHMEYGRLCIAGVAVSAGLERDSREHGLVLPPAQKHRELLAARAWALQTHNSAPQRSRHRTVHSASFAFRLLCIRSIHNGITFIARKGNEPA